MKDKIYKFIGEAITILAKWTTILVVMIIICVNVVEHQKEEIWLEVSESFQIQYDTKEAELYNRFGIVDEDEVDQWDYRFETYEVSVKDQTEVPNTPQSKPDAIIEIETLCSETNLPESDEFDACIIDQLNAMELMFFGYMKVIDEMEDINPAKLILQALVVECTIQNTTESGIVDNRKAFNCIRSNVEAMNEKLDEEIQKQKYKQGI